MPEVLTAPLALEIDAAPLLVEPTDAAMSLPPDAPAEPIEKVYHHTLADGREVTGNLTEARELCKVIGGMSIEQSQHTLDNADRAHRVAERMRQKREAAELKRRDAVEPSIEPASKPTVATTTPAKAAVAPAPRRTAVVSPMSKSVVVSKTATERVLRDELYGVMADASEQTESDQPKVTKLVKKKTSATRLSPKTELASSPRPIADIVQELSTAVMLPTRLEVVTASTAPATLEATPVIPELTKASFREGDTEEPSSVLDPIIMASETASDSAEPVTEATALPILPMLRHFRRKPRLEQADSAAVDVKNEPVSSDELHALAITPEITNTEQIVAADELKFDDEQVPESLSEEQITERLVLPEAFNDEYIAETFTLLEALDDKEPLPIAATLHLDAAREATDVPCTIEEEASSLPEILAVYAKTEAQADSWFETQFAAEITVSRPMPLEAVAPEANAAPLEVTFARLATYLTQAAWPESEPVPIPSTSEGPKPLLELAESQPPIILLAHEVRAALAAVIEEIDIVVNDSGEERLLLTPEATVQLVRLLHALGYEQPQATLMSFVESYGLFTLLQTVRHLQYLAMAGDLQRAALAAAATQDDYGVHLFTRLGMVIMSLFATTTSATILAIK